jgi:hypothetical protein
MPFWKPVLKGPSKFEKNLTEGLSFPSEVREFCDILNRKMDETPKVPRTPVISHPGGFFRELHRRRLSIAESYIQIVKNLDSDHYEERLFALKNLARQSLHAKTTRLPLNTARVQTDLMKEAIKSRNNRRKQLELLSDFSLASYGDEHVIRRLCKSFYLIEVPDSGKPLKDLRMGWDSHVHDNVSEGRKTPSQVVLDAFIKGISEVILSHYTLGDERIIRETYDAGLILGVKAQIGVEFSVGQKWNRRHYMYVPPYFEDPCDLIKFLKDPEKDLASFVGGLNENADRRRQTVSHMLETFNQEHLPRINEGYSQGDPEFCEALHWDDLQTIVLNGQASRIHLGELLFAKLRPIYFKRILLAKAQYELAKYRYHKKELSDLEFDIVEAQYMELRKVYTTLSPVGLREKFIDGSTREDYDSSFRAEEEVLPALVATGGHVVYIHPLEGGLKKAIEAVLVHHGGITHVESFNMQDSFKRNPNDLRLFNSFIGVLNEGNAKGLRDLIEQLNIPFSDVQCVELALSTYQKKPLIPWCGSDSTGKDPTIPGMGFISPTQIPKKIRRYYKKNHYALPFPISKLILKYRDRDLRSDNQESGAILSMGKTVEPFYNAVGDEEEYERPSIARVWNYLNPYLKMIIRIGISFPFAYFMLGLGYSLIWYGITFLRNILVDFVSAKGLDPRDWSMRDINLENATQSLFWTGFSVPLLTFVKLRVDGLFLLANLTNAVGQQVIRFFAICFANGAYISLHNRLRHFDEKVIKANFFRSVFAWPPATVFSFLGDFLTVPSIVQAKFWSDLMAGVIEGTGKSSQQIHLRKRDLWEILPQLYSENRRERTIAMLDILYIWARRRKGKASLRQVLQSEEEIRDSIQRLPQAEECDRRPEPSIRKEPEYVLKLKDLFLADGAFAQLIDFTNREFEGKNAYLINSIVAVHYPRFCDWLRNLPA